MKVIAMVVIICQTQITLYLISHNFKDSIIITLLGLGVFAIVFNLAAWSLRNGYWRRLYPRLDVTGTWQLSVFNALGDLSRVGVCWMEEREGRLVIWGETFTVADGIENPILDELDPSQKEGVNYWRSDWVMFQHPELRYVYHFPHNHGGPAAPVTANETPSRPMTMKLGFTDLMIRGGTSRPELIEGTYFDYVPAPRTGRLVFKRLSNSVKGASLPVRGIAWLRSWR